MTKRAIFFALATLLGVFGARPAYGQKKDTLLLMRQLDAMQQTINSIQKTVDSQTAVLRTLVEQANDNVNSMKGTVDELRKATQQNLASTNARFDTLTSQMQTLSESLEEAKARLAKLSEQQAQTQNIIQTLNAPPSSATATPGAPGAAAPTSVPDAETLYKSGLSYFSGGQYQLAVQAFQEYLQYYGDTDLASNAQFYIGECYYSQNDYAKAVEEYNKCIEQFPKGNKAAAAQLKKGYALIEMNQQQAGVRELRSLVQRYPNAREADLARQRLRKLGVSASGRRGGE
ncbi:MAG: tol-pal system protein YbgF [Terriglobia bacterium]